MTFEDFEGYEIRRTESSTTLVPTDLWSDAATAAMESGGIDGLGLNYVHGFRNPDLSFLGDWPIKQLNIIARGMKDLTGLDRVSSKLESLWIDSHPSATIDLSRFPSLTSVRVDWAQIRATVKHGTHIEELHPLHYREQDLGPLSDNKNLRLLVFKNYPRMTSLNGIEKLPNLEHFAAFLAPLSDIDALRSIEGPLTELELKSSRLYDLDPISHCTGLEFLNVSECREIESLKPLSSLTNLTKLHAYGSTRVTDGDLAPLLNLTNLKRLKMQNRRFYNPSVAEVMKQLGAQR